MKIAKFNILSVLDCHYRLFQLIYISYDSEELLYKDPVRIERFWLLRSFLETLLNIMNVKNLWLQPYPSI